MPKLEKRIKPKLLREQKTEALLLFIRTTLESFFLEIDEKNTYAYLSVKEDTIEINLIIKKLFSNLEKTIISTHQLNEILLKAQYDNRYKLLLKQEDALITYYDVITKTLGNNLSNGDKWIPELLILILLSEWLLEEEKSSYLYPYLEEIDYINLISKYDLAKKNLEEEKKEIINNMYRLSSKLVKQLKTFKYRLPKKRKKR